MQYINRKDGRDVETVDQFPTLKEAKRMVSGYQMSDRGAEYYISSRSTFEWRSRQ